MHGRCAFFLIATCACLAGALPGRAAADTAVYGFELEVDESRERLLIFADAPLAPELIPVDERTLMVSLPGAVLDPSAPTRIQPVVQGTVVRVTAFDRAEGAAPEVRVVVQHRPGAEPQMEQRASVIALDFEPRPRAPADADTIEIGYHNAPMDRVVTDLARAIGETLIFDDALSGLGVLTVEGPPRVSRAEAIALLDSVLLLRGFAAVPAAGGGRMIVPIEGAPGPWVADHEWPDSDAPITTLIRLESASATDLVPVVTPYLGSSATVSAFEETNSLILSGPGSRLRRLRTAIEALDRVEASQSVIWPLRYADPETTAEQLTEIVGDRELPVAVGDVRTRSLLLRVQPSALEHVRSVVDRLDRPERGGGELDVIPLRFADPESLATQLKALRDAPESSEETATSSRTSGLQGLPFDVVADRASGSLVVRADPHTFASLLDVVRAVDRAPTSVRLEVTIAIVELENQLDLGTDFFIPTVTNPKTTSDLVATVFSNPSGGGIQQLPSAQKPFVASFTRAPLLLPVVDPVTGTPIVLQIPRESFSITMNHRSVRTYMLMRPQLLLVGGEENELFAGDNVPVPVARSEGGGEGAATTGNPLQVVQNIERYDVGTTLRVTPTVGIEGGVSLEMLVEVSSLKGSSAGPVSQVGPTIGNISVESTIRLRHGEVAVIATAGQEAVSQSEVGIPWFKDIPILGFLFRATTDMVVKRYLLVAAQAEILRPEVLELARALADELGPLDAAAALAGTESPDADEPTSGDSSSPR